MNPNNHLHKFILEAVKSNFSIQSEKTDCHGDLGTTSAPSNSPISHASAHSINGTTLLLSADDPTDDPTNRNSISHQGVPWLLLLPTEIRCMIWRELLVTTKVYISFTNCRLLMAQRGAKRKQRATRRVYEFDENHIEYYGILGDDDNGEEADVGTYFSPRRCHDDWTEYIMHSMSVPTAEKFQDSYHPRPHLDIFRACRQIRDEAESIFYSENCFTFCTCNQFNDYNAARDISSAHAAYCFFKDRSPQALKEIKNIELHAMDWEFIRDGSSSHD